MLYCSGDERLVNLADGLRGYAALMIIEWEWLINQSITIWLQACRQLFSVHVLYYSMKIPVIHGIIDRRILVNFTTEPAAVSAMLPAGFRPKLVKGKAIVGICLIRLKQIKPKGLPDFLGVSSENGAHRIAVEWEENGALKEGVYIPRRDTSSRFNALAGGRFFPGRHYFTKFNVREEGKHYHVSFTSADATRIAVTGNVSDAFPKDSVFGSLQEASAFFKAGAVGYSPDGGNKLNGLHLDVFQWQVQPLDVTAVETSFFKDARFDNALLMTNAEHEWKGIGDKMMHSGK